MKSKMIKGCLATLFGPFFGPERFSKPPNPDIIWPPDGILANFKPTHDLDILVSTSTFQCNKGNFHKTWETDADEVIFRRGKQIKLYWRKE